MAEAEVEAVAEAVVAEAGVAEVAVVAEAAAESS